MIPASKERDEETVKLSRYYFGELLKEEAITEQQGTGLLPEYFLKWVGPRLGDDARLGKLAAVLKAAGAREVGAVFLRELADDQLGARRLEPLWPFVTLHYRGVPKHTVKAVQVTLKVAFDDGRIYLISRNLPAEMLLAQSEMGERLVITDSFAVTHMQSQCRSAIDEIVQTGLDTMHERADDFGGEEPYNALMGCILRYVKPIMKPEIWIYAERYFRFFQLSTWPPVRKELQRLVAENRAKQVAFNQEDTGGFSE